jgi:hypothetical protein
VKRLRPRVQDGYTVVLYWSGRANPVLQGSPAGTRQQFPTLEAAKRFLRNHLDDPRGLWERGHVKSPLGKTVYRRLSPPW